MEFYDFIYPKEALNIYIFLFSDKDINDNQKKKIKDLLCVIYNKAISEFGDEIDNIKQYVESIDNVKELDKIIFEDSVSSKWYNFLPIHEAIKQHAIMEKYQECLLKIKEVISNADFEELKHFLNVKNYVDSILQQISSNAISQEKLSSSREEVSQNLIYLEKYMDKKDIESYKTCIKIKLGESVPYLSSEVIKLFEMNKGEIKFSELEQLKDLENKEESAMEIIDSHFENIVLNSNEQKEINHCIIKEILKYLPVLFVLILILNEIFKNGATDIRNNGFILNSVLIILMLIFGTFLFFTIKYIIVFCFKNRFSKGAIGFIASIKKSPAGNGSFYNVYFPKYNERYSIGVASSSKIIHFKRKTLVALVKIMNTKLLIPLDISRYL